MITIGLTGWTDQPLIAPSRNKKLEEYSSHFPFVEMDTSFYGIPSESSIASWIEKTPEVFQFIPKAYGAMTQHKPWNKEFNSIEELFDTYKVHFYPFIKEKKMKAFLFQFPPFFHFNQKNMDYLKLVSHLMGTLSVAVEFRHPNWFSKENKAFTLKLLEELYFIHTIVDQPQTPGNSIPQILEVTNSRLAIFRLHGQNYSGWLNAADTDNWRETRTLYDYSQDELTEFKRQVQDLEPHADEISVIFNNNSGGHAAKTLRHFNNY